MMRTSSTSSSTPSIMSSSFPPQADHHRLDADAGFLRPPPVVRRALVPPPNLCRTSTSTTSIAEAGAATTATPTTTLPSSMISSSSCWAASNNNKKHRSCGCAGVSVDDGGSYDSYSSRRRCDQCTCSDLRATASALPVEMNATTAPPPATLSSTTTIEMELEQCIKRVRLSSTPGELCLHKELRGMTVQGWQWYDHCHPSATQDATASAVDSEERMPSSLSSRRRDRGVATSTREDALITASRRRRSSGSVGWADSSCEYGWYEKILDNVVSLGAQQRQAAGDREGEMRHACCRCRMRLEALSTHRLALHLHYYYYGRARDPHDCDDVMHRSSHNNVVSVATVHVDVRIPRHYPHQPPEVKSIRYSDDGNDDSDSFPSDMDDDVTLSSRQLLSLCRVDSITLVPFVTDDDYDDGHDDDPGDQELSDNYCDSQGPAHVDPLDSMAGISLHHLHVQAPVANARRALTLHGYSPVHRLSDVLERIAVALYSATVHNTTLTHTEHGTEADSRSTRIHGNVGACAGSDRDADSLSPSPTGAFSSSSLDASWASTATATLQAAAAVAAAVPAATAIAATEADQATEKQRSG